MGRQRIEDVSCAICIDSLFTKRDDLDDLVPIATCDCGHVFHEECLLEWFRTQSQQYVANAREHGMGGRDGSPSLSDAPAECPSCRTECFADPETGEPSIHRLFIDWGGVLDSVPSSSAHPSSSPAPTRKVRDREILGLAKRAKALTAEASDLGAESKQDDWRGMVTRTEGLIQDAVSLKALSSVQAYITGLKVSLDQLHARLESDSLNPELRLQNRALASEIADLQDQLRTTVPREVRRAVEAERSRMEKRVAEAQKERDIMQRHYQEEKVRRKHGVKDMMERKAEMDKKMAEVEKSYENEKREREATQDTLRERNKLLKLMQAKVESRKEIKSQLDDLRAENQRLKAAIAAGPVSSGSAAITSSASGSRWRAPSLRLGSSRITDEADESLQIDMPSFADDSVRSMSGLLPAQTTAGALDRYTVEDVYDPSSRSAGNNRKRAHPTARTIAYDLTVDKQKKRKTSSKYFAADGPPPDTDKENQQWSIASPDDSDEGSDLGRILGRYEPHNRDLFIDRSPSPRKEAGYMVPATSSPEPYDVDQSVEHINRPAANARANPFATTRQASDSRKSLPSFVPDTPQVKLSRFTAKSGERESRGQDAGVKEVIDLASSSPPASPLPAAPPQRKKHDQTYRPGEGSVADWLRVRDANGRPTKGVVSGQKVKRRA
ncbi:hypothetical protein IAU60_006116 [Kwoniella sp. DSM 27419]